MMMVEDEVCRSYEEGGPERLAAHLRRLDYFLSGQHLLTDAQGRDLATGRDRCDLLRRGQSPPEPPRLSEGHFVLIGRPRGGQYRFIRIVEPGFDPRSLWPYYGLIVLVIALMGSILAAHLAAPLRRLRTVVDRFGHGDLSARSGSGRKDEIGELSRAFDEMAARIETLLAAERRLLQDVSHELRSPLARLGFAVELARTSEDRNAALDRIKKDVGRLSVLVDELLQLTRAEGDPSAREIDDLRLDELLRLVVDDCTLEAEANGCRLVLRGDSVATIRGEWELLRRSVENVVRNAIRFAPSGTNVEIELRRREGTATVTVRDYGVGVPESSLSAIFEPFFRVEGDRSRTSGGVGLGLAIARRALALHGGRIYAANAQPGLRVTLELPGIEDAREPRSGPAAAVSNLAG
jgi:two-component system sensor histidine kinase CpxA